jgi:hypothetical protein
MLNGLLQLTETSFAKTLIVALDVAKGIRDFSTHEQEFCWTYDSSGVASEGGWSGTITPAFIVGVATFPLVCQQSFGNALSTDAIWWRYLTSE